MTTVETQARRLLGIGDGRRASANAYLALIGVVGAVGWGGTALVRHLVEDDIVMFGWAGLVVAGWLALTGGRLAAGAVNVSRRESFSAPFVVWLVLIAGAFAANGYGLTLGESAAAEQLMCMPWLAAMSVGYLMTGLMVERGGVYLAAGALGVAVAGAALTVGSPPFSLVVLGLFNAVPLLVDAHHGGRELAENGRPRVAVRRSDETPVAPEL